MLKIGFAILSHNHPEQLLRLTKTLTQMFDGPPIACHHDFSQSAISNEPFSKNVSFVKPSTRTMWGDISVPLAAIRAFRLLHETSKPDWYVLLSGTDYPCRSASEIISELKASSFDAYLDYRDVTTGVVPEHYVGPTSGFSRASWIPMGYERYVSAYWWRPLLIGKMLKAGRFPFRRKHYAISNQRINRWYQAKRAWPVYGGDLWFHANNKAIECLLDPAITEPFIKYFKGRLCPDEAIFQSILCNQPQLRVNKDSKRFEDWEGSVDPHPQWIEEHNLPMISQSGAHFARKFRSDGIVQDLMDASILGLRSKDPGNNTSEA